MVAQLVRNYEVVVLLNPEMTEDEIAEAVKGVDGMVEEHGGEVTEPRELGTQEACVPRGEVQRGQLRAHEVLPGTLVRRGAEPQLQGV